jgi:HEAT repeat protein
VPTIILAPFPNKNLALSASQLISRTRPPDHCTQLGSLGGYLKVQAGKALVDVPDPLGVAILEEMLTSPLGIDRLNAAEALVTTNRDRAWQLIRDLIENGSPVTRPAALEVAGRVGLGTDRVVYRRLIDADPESRGQAVAAIARTLSGSVPLGVSPPGPASQ